MFAPVEGISAGAFLYGSVTGYDGERDCTESCSDCAGKWYTEGDRCCFTEARRELTMKKLSAFLVAVVLIPSDGWSRYR